MLYKSDYIAIQMENKIEREMNKKQLNIRIEEDLLNALKVKLEQYGDDTTITDFLKNIIQEEVRPNGFGHNIFETVSNHEDYIPFSRIILKEDKIDNRFKAYKRDIATKSYVISKRGATPDMVIEAEELLIPTYRIATNPEWDFEDDSEEYRKQIDKQIEYALNIEEDKQVLIAMDCAVNCRKKSNIYNLSLTNGYRTACGELKENLITPKYILIHPWLYETSKDEILSIIDKNISIIESIMVPKTSIYITGNEEILGRIVVRKDTTKVQCDNPKIFKYGVVAYRYIGTGIINDYALCKVTLQDKNEIELLKIKDKCKEIILTEEKSGDN